MNKYLCYYKGKKVEVLADTSYSAQQKAVGEFRIKEKQRKDITVFLCVKADGTAIVQYPD